MFLTKAWGGAVFYSFTLVFFLLFFYNVQALSSVNGSINNLTVWNNGSVYMNNPIAFYANYTNMTTNSFSKNANCNITFSLGIFSMSENVDLYSYIRSFTIPGVLEYNISCHNTTEEWLNVSDNVTIFANTAPTISTYNPSSLSPSIGEPNNETFSLVYTDNEHNATLTWFVNGTNQTPFWNKTEYNFTGNYSSAGSYNITAFVTDGEYNNQTSWTLMVNETNRAPTIDSSFPASATPSIFEPNNETFNITHSDPDGNISSVSWYLNGTQVSTLDEYNFSGNYSSAGSYNITVIIDDGLTDCEEWILNVSNVDVEFPSWISNITYPASGIAYSSTRNYFFNVTWNDDVGLDIVLFEHNFTGVLGNYSPSFNLGNDYVYNSTPLAAGTYVWRSYANDTSGNLNMTNQWTYVIEKQTTITSLQLNGQTQNITVTYPHTVNASASTSNESLTLYRDGVDITGENGTNVLHGVGTYNYTAVNLGNENFTGSSQTFFATINQNVSSCSLSIAPSSPIAYTLGAIVNATCSCTNPEQTAQMYRDNVNVSLEKNILVALGAGTYSYVCNVTSSQNYTNATISSSYTIDKANHTLHLAFNGSESNQSYVYPAFVNTTAWLEIDQQESNAVLYRDGVQIDTGNMSTEALVLGAGVYQYVFNYTVTQNYTFQKIHRSLEINASSTALSLNAQPSWTVANGTSTNVTCFADNSAVNVALWRNTTLVNSGIATVLNDTTLLSIGSYNYTCNTTGNQNYTTATTSSLLQVTGKTVSTCTLGFSPVSGAEYPVSVTATCSCNNPESSATLYREGVDITGENATPVLLGAGSYTYLCNTSETQNYTAGQDSSSYSINVNTSSTLLLQLNGTSGNYTTYAYDDVLVNATLLIPSSGNVDIYVNQTLNNSGTSPNAIVLTFGNTGEYLVEARYNATQNYSTVNMSYTLTVLPPPDVSAPLISNLSNTTTNESVVIIFNTDDASNVTLIMPGPGTFSNATFATDHSIFVNSLTNETQYFYNITLCNNDGYCSQNTGYSFTTNVTSTNAAPVWNASTYTYTTTEDTDFTSIDLYPFVADDTDPDTSLMLTVDGQTNASVASCSIVSNRYLDCSVIADKNGQNNVTVRAQDTLTQSNTALFVMNTTPVNDAPVINTSLPDAQFDEDSWNDTMDLSSWVSDVDGDIITWTVTNGSNIFATVIGSSVNFTSSPNYYGTQNLLFIAEDGNGGNDTYTMSVTVRSINDAPVVSRVYATKTTLHRTEAFNIYCSANDIETTSSSLVYRIQYNISNATTWTDCSESWDSSRNQSYCAITTTTADSQLGNWSLHCNVTDGSNSSSLSNSTAVEVLNNVPSFVVSSPYYDYTYGLGENISFMVSATDVEDGLLPASSFTWTSDKDGNFLNGTGWFENLSENMHSITLAVNDTDTSYTNVRSTFIINVTSDTFDNYPYAQLTSPEHNSTATMISTTFQCSVVEDNTLENITMYSNHTGNWSIAAFTNSSSSLSYSAVLSDGDYMYNCYACDNASQCRFAKFNATFVRAYAPYCGDAICNNGESCSSCASDCEVCPTSSSSSTSVTSSSGGGSSIPLPEPTTEDNTSSESIEVLSPDATATLYKIELSGTSENLTVIFSGNFANINSTSNADIIISRVNISSEIDPAIQQNQTTRSIVSENETLVESTVFDVYKVTLRNNSVLSNGSAKLFFKVPDAYRILEENESLVLKIGDNTSDMDSWQTVVVGSSSTNEFVELNVDSQTSGKYIAMVIEKKTTSTNPVESDINGRNLPAQIAIVLIVIMCIALLIVLIRIALKRGIKMKHTTTKKSAETDGSLSQINISKYHEHRKEIEAIQRQIVALLRKGKTRDDIFPILKKRGYTPAQISVEYFEVLEFEARRQVKIFIDTKKLKEVNTSEEDIDTEIIKRHNDGIAKKEIISYLKAKGYDHRVVAKRYDVVMSYK